jgi:hypothetical protein
MIISCIALDGQRRRAIYVKVMTAITDRKLGERAGLLEIWRKGSDAETFFVQEFSIWYGHGHRVSIGRCCDKGFFVESR